MPVNIMWFKRDLRISDNHALLEATIAKEPLICIYNLDSERILRDDVDGIHIKWELDCLSLLKIDLENLGGKLIVALNSDLSVKKLKGKSRPINNESDRKKFLSYFNFIDSITSFNEETPYNLIKKLKPTLLGP